MEKKRRKVIEDLSKDVIIIIFSIIVTWLCIQLGVFEMFFNQGKGNILFVTFVAGIFFTSAFTIAPAGIILAKVADMGDPLTTILVGGLGAMFGDLVIYLFIRNVFAIHLQNAVNQFKWKRRIASFHFGFIKWLTPIIGALIISLPLPNEFGLALLGMSKVRLIIFFPLTFVMNCIGIYMLFLATQVIGI